VTRVSENGTRDNGSKRPENEPKKSFGLGRLLDGLSGLIEKLGDMAEEDGEIARLAGVKGARGNLHSIYGINVKTALDQDGHAELKVEPFGNVRRGPAGFPGGKDVREPVIEVWEDLDHVLVLAELPGVAKDDIKLDVADGRLALFGDRGTTVYLKEVELPEGCSANHPSWEYRDGILQVRFGR